MEEIYPCRKEIDLDFKLEELESRLEATLIFSPEGMENEPCAWTCDCFGVIRT